MSFALYLVGFLLMIVGISWALARAGLATVWIVIIGVILLGLGIIKGVTRARSRDLPKDPS
jgi:membrane-bound acyltransferase YfiQ involved in biofilm formation